MVGGTPQALLCALEPMAPFFRLTVILAFVQLGAGSGRAEPGTRDAGRRPWESFATRVIALEAGLPSNGSPLAVQTRDGYLWFATEAGLSRYDGVRLATFRRHDTPALADDWIRDLFEDSSGTLWIGTWNGLTTYRDGQFRAVPELQQTRIASLTGDQAGHVWIGTIGSGLWESSGGQFIHWADNAILHRDDDVPRAFADSAGRLWAARRNGGIALLENGKFQLPPGGASLPMVAGIMEYPRGTLWLATAGGLFQSGAV